VFPDSVRATRAHQVEVDMSAGAAGEGCGCGIEQCITSCGGPDRVTACCVELAHGWFEAIAGREGAKLKDVLSGLMLPAGASTLHADADDRLARCLAVAAADRHAAFTRARVVHAIHLVLEVGDRRVNRLLGVQPSPLRIDEMRRPTS